MRKLSFIFLVLLLIIAFTGCDININISNDMVEEPEVTATVEPEVTTQSAVEDSTSTISETDVQDETSLVSSAEDSSGTLDSCTEPSVVSWTINLITKCCSSPIFYICSLLFLYCLYIYLL